MSKYGDIDFDEKWYDTPIEAYLDHKRTTDGVTDTRLNDIYNAVVESPQECEWDAWDEFVDWQDGMTVADAEAFHKQLEDAGLASRTVEGRLRIVQSFLKELLERDVVSSNPVAYFCDNTDFDYEEKDKIDRDIDEIGTFLEGIQDHQFRAQGTTFAKTGIRNGENYNIDLPFVHLDHQLYYDLLDQHDVTLHNEVEDYPDSIYIPSEPTIGEVFRGEKRKAGNKRKRGTRIPIDNELKKALLD